jgi:hypothetical protein
LQEDNSHATQPDYYAALTKSKDTMQPEEDDP